MLKYQHRRHEPLSVPALTMLYLSFLRYPEIQHTVVSACVYFMQLFVYFPSVWCHIISLQHLNVFVRGSKIATSTHAVLNRNQPCYTPLLLTPYITHASRLLRSYNSSLLHDSTINIHNHWFPCLHPRSALQEFVIFFSSKFAQRSHSTLSVLR